MKEKEKKERKKHDYPPVRKVRVYDTKKVIVKKLRKLADEIEGKA